LTAAAGFRLLFAICENERERKGKRVIALKLLLGFLEVVFIGVAMEWLVDDEDVWSVECKYQLKKAMAFDPTVGSRSKFHRGFHMLFSLGYLWNGYSVTRMSVRSNLSIALEGP
jgi:hypothetical protein